ncbi:MAG TPA: DUF2911 domain-containing protein [Vicinamibacterales bacterium]|nr:DUF2911 domain-containing protein [Vicinamibacterales bacterium]
MSVKTKLVVMVAMAASAVVAAQVAEVNLPPSPRGSAAVQVSGSWAGTGADRKYSGGLWITVDYGRPVLRGRENIFGAGADYGQTVTAGGALWRAGANETTRLLTQAPLVIAGKTIPPGEYNVLVDLKEQAWTFVLTNQPIQPQFDANDKVRLLGSTNYDPKFDLVRAPMRLTTSPMVIEQFTIGFADVKADRGTLYMSWDRTIASIDFTVGK